MRPKKKRAYHCHWGSEDIKRLIQFWNLGHPAQGVAIKMGNNTTKNMVLGLIFRLRKKGWKLR